MHWLVRTRPCVDLAECCREPEYSSLTVCIAFSLALILLPIPYCQYGLKFYDQSLFLLASCFCFLDLFYCILFLIAFVGFIRFDVHGPNYCLSSFELLQSGRGTRNRG